MKYLNKFQKIDCIKSELVQKDFSSILIKLHVISLDSPKNSKSNCFAKHLFWLLLFFRYCNALVILIILIICQYI